MANQMFEVVESFPVAALGVTYTQYRHQPTGARHYHLASEDPHNAFMIAFPTLPDDSSGVAHILEHTTLCGSRRYPVRDPFFMMLRRSLNTYMNAFTSGDATAYPFATQNHKDYENLLAVYLDAVFFPRLDPLDFAQEGWRVEVRGEGADSRLELHGVVYNEMKGAMSSPLTQLWQHLHTVLFPDAVYHHNSGGDPLRIPDLSHEQLRAFHARHYHPSNAVLMTYGNFPVAEQHARFAELALDHFDERRSQLVSPLQSPFIAPREHEFSYAVDEDGAAQTHIVWGWMFGTSADADAFIEGHLLETILLEHGASPLRHYLESTTLASAPSELCGLDDSTRQLVFLCGVEGSEVAHAEALERDIVAVIARFADDGMDADALDAVVDRLELAQRDIGGGSYPFGLQLMGRMMPAAMYRGAALDLLDLGPAIARLRKRIGEAGYLRALVARVLLDNPHRVRVVMRPDSEKHARDAACEAARLEALRAGMDTRALAALHERALALRQRQAQIDDDRVLPRVTLADVPPAQPLQQPVAVHGTAAPIAEYECGTNGVFRIKLALRLPLLSAAEIGVLPLWCEYVTELGCGSEDYLAVQARRVLSGTYSVYPLSRPVLGDANASHAWLIVSGKGLARKRNDIICTSEEIVSGVRFDEHARLHELLRQSRAEAEQSITERGHHLAILAAARPLSRTAALDEVWDGPSAVKLLQRTASAQLDIAALDALFELFASIRDKLAEAPRRIAMIGEGDVLRGAHAQLSAAVEHGSSPFRAFDAALEEHDTANAWITNSQVNFCAKAYSAAEASSNDAPVMSVLARYLQDGFLHREIREQGGAYGSGAGYDSDSGTFRFYSYRDPRLRETLHDFDRALAWYTDHNDPQRVEESILGTIRALDQPRSPAGEAERAFINALCGRDDAYRKKYRDAALAVTHADLVRVGQRFLVADRGCAAVIGGAASAAAMREAGMQVERL